MSTYSPRPGTALIAVGDDGQAGCPPGTVDCDLAGTGPAAAVAVAAVSAWRGAPAVRTRHVAAVRRALDMAAAIRGDQPPRRAVRGLG
ncbi:MAG: hypothetical protein J2P35_04305 [Actinobacteria bacterium]|nr:hypothetical protein [Actinomycetota bacterium]MBO0784623.1 hypothetical protein [Actinomycetota bacterium]